MELDIKGYLIDDKSRCVHYNSVLDIIAIKMKCCDQYYACIECHNEMEHHTPKVWKAVELGTSAILCGECKTQFTIQQYLDCNNKCPICNKLFNPKCSNHYHYYFEI